MNTPPLGFWRRFIAVFSPTFLLRLNKEKKEGKSWGFWFLSNFFIVLIPAIVIAITGSIFLSDFPKNAINKIPDEQTFQLSDDTEYSVKDLLQNFEFSITDTLELTTNNVPDPFIVSTTATGDTFFTTDIAEVDMEESEFVFMLDTKGKTTTIDDISVFKSGLFLLHDQFISKEGNNGQTKIMNFQELLGNNESVEYPLTLNMETIANAGPIFSKMFYWLLGVAFIGLYLLIAVLRLIPVLFWSLVFWGIGAIVKIKDWDFQKSFMGMLHLSFIPMLLLPLGITLGIPFLSPIILVLLWGANFYEIKKRG